MGQNDLYPASATIVSPTHTPCVYTLITTKEDDPWKNLSFMLDRTNYTPLEPLEASKGYLSRQVNATAREHFGINKFYTSTNSLKVDRKSHKSNKSVTKLERY